MRPRIPSRAVVRALVCLLLLSVAFGAIATAQRGSIVMTEHGPNAPEHWSKPYVILISLDGFRYDYARLHGAAHLQSIAARGATAPDGLIPTYPPVTFSSHYTILTGLYPANHGIVANSFYDPERREWFRAGTRNDGSWYGGVPLWALAEQQGMRTASLLWPGTYAEIDGVRPTYNVRVNARISDQERLDQVVAWLRLPPEQRPHFIMLHLAHVDHAAHDYGTESEEVRLAVQQVDGLLGRLVLALSGLGLPVNLFVVSDHGMEDVVGDWINLEAYADLSEFETIGSLLYAPNEEAAAKVYQHLGGGRDKFTVYRRAEIPAHLGLAGNARVGDPVVIANGPYLIRARAPRASTPIPEGRHSYDRIECTPCEEFSMHSDRTFGPA
jgi:alkaline phosphatase D